MFYATFKIKNILYQFFSLGFIYVINKIIHFIEVFVLLISVIRFDQGLEKSNFRKDISKKNKYQLVKGGLF